MKRRLLAIALIVLALSLAACTVNGNNPSNGNNGNNGSSKGTPNFNVPEGGYDSSKKVEITFYHTMGSNLSDVLDLYITEFNKLYPNITVKAEKIGGYDRDQRKEAAQPRILLSRPCCSLQPCEGCRNTRQPH